IVPKPIAVEFMLPDETCLRQNAEVSNLTAAGASPHVQPSSSLVLAASCLSMSATMPSAPPFFVLCTCFSTRRMVSSECPSLAFFTCATAFERTLLRESLALLLNCLAVLARFSLCSRVTLRGRRPEKKVSSPANKSGPADYLTSGWLRGNFPSGVDTTMWSRTIPGEVLMLRLRVKSSLSALTTAAMSSFTSSRLMMSSTRAALIFTLAACPFVLARRRMRKVVQRGTRRPQVTPH
uniref:Uncharacterized protein n=1 Tax=Hippocampus comes TaxID=109280 RepID=A0A3Q2XCH7_HIPCM